MPTVPIDLRMQQELRRLAETCADELDLPYDVLEPSGWTVRTTTPRGSYSRRMLCPRWLTEGGA